MHKHRAFGALIGLGLAAGVGMALGRMMAHYRYAYEHEGTVDTPGTPEHRHEFRHGFKHMPWRKGYPPMFEEWHRRAHAQDAAEDKPAAEAKPEAAEEKPAATPTQA
jgi:hypothetical protein